MSRNIKKIPTCSKVQDLDNQRSFMILKVFTEELKNLGRLNEVILTEMFVLQNTVTILIYSKKYKKKF